MPNTTYTLENETDKIVVDGELSSYPDVTVGDTTSFDFFIRGEVETQPFNATGGTYGGAAGVTYGGPTGATVPNVVVDFFSSGAAERYRRLKEYQRYAGKVATGGTLESAYYRETATFDEASINGLVVRITPGEGVAEAQGVWGVIESISDGTELFNGVARVSMEVFVLARASDYESIRDVRRAFEADI